MVAVQIGREREISLRLQRADRQGRGVRRRPSKALPWRCSLRHVWTLF